VQATIYNLAGESVGTVELDETIFGVTPNHGVIHQAVLRQQANARQGTHSTKTRAFVSGGGKKPWRQKGTGRARQGSTRSPQWRHGGVVFGPHPRSYDQDMPRKMRRLAIRGVLSGKVADGQLVLVDSFENLEPRTKAMMAALTALNIGEKKALIFTTGEDTVLRKAAGNLPNVSMLSAHLLSVVDMLKTEYVVMPRAALDVVTSILGTTGGRRKLVMRGSSNGNGSTVPATATETATTTATENMATEPTGKVAKKAAATTREASAETAAETATATVAETTTASASTEAEAVTEEKAPAKRTSAASRKSAAKAAETTTEESTTGQAPAAGDETEA
jgi:large subunit ribosomal protein L4